MKIVTSILLSIYLGMSPVYWWPGVDPEILDAIKLAIIALAVGLVWLSAFTNGHLNFPKGVIGPLGFVMLLLLSFVAVSQSTIEASQQQLKDYVLAFVMLWTFTFYIGIGGNTCRVFWFATLIIGIHCLVVCASKFVGFPRWYGPKHFVAPELWVSGFGSLRTGWSCGVALFVPLALGLVMDSRRSVMLRVIFSILACGIVLSQLVVAGRAGILASFIGIIWIVTGRGYRRWLPFVMTGAIIGLVGAQEFLYEALRLSDLGGGKIESVHDLNKFSAHRVDSDLIAWRKFIESPIMGHGFHEFTFGGGTEIHNLWLRLAVEGGAFLPLGLLWIVWTIWKSVCGVSISRFAFEGVVLSPRHLQAVVLMGLVMSLFEPRILLGAFQLYALWWATAGVAAGAAVFRRAHGQQSLNSIRQVPVSRYLSSSQ